MNNTDKVYLIKWVGPFSYDELYNWERNGWRIIMKILICTCCKEKENTLENFLIIVDKLLDAYIED